MEKGGGGGKGWGRGKGRGKGRMATYKVGEDGQALLDSPNPSIVLDALPTEMREENELASSSPARASKKTPPKPKARGGKHTEDTPAVRLVSHQTSALLDALKVCRKARSVEVRNPLHLPLPLPLFHGGTAPRHLTLTITL